MRCKLLATVTAVKLGAQVRRDNGGGAATLAGLRAVYDNEELRSGLAVPSDAVIVLVSTEGLAANPLPH